jgi:hypothetical protein
MSRQGVGRDVIGLNQRGVKKITQRDAIAGLKANEIFARADERFGRNGRELIQITCTLFRPIDYDHGGRDFGQAADLTFVPGIDLIQDKTSLRIDDDIGARSLERAASGQTEREREKSDEKAAGNYHGNKNRCTLIAGASLATAESDWRACGAVDAASRMAFHRNALQRLS